jgi:hypothetical protein
MGLKGEGGMKGEPGLEGLRVSWKKIFNFSRACVFFWLKLTFF